MSNPRRSVHGVVKVGGGDGVAGDPDLHLVLEREQQQRHADRRDGEDQSRRVTEATDDEDLDRGAEDDRTGDEQRDDEEVVDVLAQHEQQRGHRRNRSQLGLGEVDDAAASVDEHQAHSEQAVEQTDRRSVQVDRVGDRLVTEAERDEAEVESPEDDLDQALHQQDVRDDQLERRAEDRVLEGCCGRPASPW